LTRAEQHARLHAQPSVEQLRRTLPDAADSLHSMLCELSARPTPDGCDRLMVCLHGAQATVRSLHAALRGEGDAGAR